MPFSWTIESRMQRLNLLEKQRNIFATQVRMTRFDIKQSEEEIAVIDKDIALRTAGSLDFTRGAKKGMQLAKSHARKKIQGLEARLARLVEDREACHNEIGYFGGAIRLEALKAQGDTREWFGALPWLRPELWGLWAWGPVSPVINSNLWNRLFEADRGFRAAQAYGFQMAFHTEVTQGLIVQSSRVPESVHRRWKSEDLKEQVTEPMRTRSQSLAVMPKSDISTWLC